jgi:hypothetical protein
MDPWQHAARYGGAMVEASLELFEEGGQEIARWPKLRLSAHGATRQEAIRNLVQMVLASFTVSVERGDLKQMLDRAGVELKPLLPGERVPDRIDAVPYLVIHTDAGSRSAA